MARDGIRLRQFGQQIIECSAVTACIRDGSFPVASANPSVERRDQILATIPEALEIVLRTLNWFKGQMEQFRAEIRTFANFPTLFLSLANQTWGPRVL